MEIKINATPPVSGERITKTREDGMEEHLVRNAQCICCGRYMADVISVSMERFFEPEEERESNHIKEYVSDTSKFIPRIAKAQVFVCGSCMEYLMEEMAKGHNDTTYVKGAFYRTYLGLYQKELKSQIKITKRRWDLELEGVEYREVD